MKKKAQTLFSGGHSGQFGGRFLLFLMQISCWNAYTKISMQNQVVVFLHQAAKTAALIVACINNRVQVGLFGAHKHFQHILFCNFQANMNVHIYAK